MPPTGITGSTAANPYGDSDVAKAVAAVAAQDSPLMTQAATDGLKTANRRGLLNSSMAAGAAQDAALRVAVPIGSQQAAQIHQRNIADQTFQQQGLLADQGFKHEGLLQGERIKSAEGMQQKDITSREEMQAKQIESAQWMQGLDIESREKLASMDIESRELLANLDIEARERMLATQLSAEETRQLRDLQARSEMLGQELTAREKLLMEELSSRERLQVAEFQHLSSEREQDRALQEQIAKWNVDASERQAAAQLAAASAQADSYLKASIMQNTSLDASTREKMMASSTSSYDASLKSAESLFSLSVAGW
jgi:hypothetical protein